MPAHEELQERLTRIATSRQVSFSEGGVKPEVIESLFASGLTYADIMAMCGGSEPLESRDASCASSVTRSRGGSLMRQTKYSDARTVGEGSLFNSDNLRLLQQYVSSSKVPAPAGENNIDTDDSALAGGVQSNTDGVAILKPKRHGIT